MHAFAEALAAYAPFWMPLVMETELWMSYVWNAALSVVMKIVSQILLPTLSARPDGTGFGMPSGHCHLTAFAVVSAVSAMPSSVDATAALVASVAAVAYMAYTRVVTFKRHTIFQTVTGVVTGVVMAVANMSKNL